MKLSVVIPAYNEEENIEKCIEDVVSTFPQAEIIIVDDCSTDNTFTIVTLLSLSLPQLKVIHNSTNKGHGFSVVEGLYAAMGDYILYIDADRQIDLIKDLPEGYDIISGYRLHRNDKLFRKVISFCLKMTNLFIHGYYIKDANCPFKLYRRISLSLLLNILPDTLIIPIACLEVLARKYGMKTKTISTPHHPYQGKRKGFLQSFNPKMFQFLWSAFKEITEL